MNTDIKALLELCVTNKASDLHILAGEVPRMRVNGDLIEINNFPIIDEAECTKALFTLTSEIQQQKVITEKELNFSVSLDKDGVRFRTNLFYSMGKLGAVMRMIPERIPPLASLGLPKILSSFLNLKQGFVLVTGPTANGKSTTLAAMIEEINSQRSCNIITLEDPIEYVISSKKSIIRQRELYSDTKTFGMALKSVLREDPNVVLVGEMRDLDTISSAMTVAETGHLVFSTLHTNSAGQTIDRIVDVFPDNVKSQIRTQFASVLSAIVCQRLVPAIGGGRVAVCEILVANPAVRNAIREGKTMMIDNIIQTGMELGMITYETHLASLVKAGKVEEKVAMEYALRPQEFISQLRSVNSINSI